MPRLIPSAALACAFALLFIPPAGRAAAAGIHTSAPVQQHVTFRDATSIELQLRSTAPYDFGPASPLKVVNPAGAENVATVWANSTWRLQVAAAGPSFVQSPSGTATIPVNRLTVVTGQATTPLSTVNQQIALGNPTTKNGRAVPLNYRLALLWSDAANAAGSSYSQTVVYTAVTP